MATHFQSHFKTSKLQKYEKVLTKLCKQTPLKHFPKDTREYIAKMFCKHLKTKSKDA